MAKNMVAVMNRHMMNLKF